MASRAEQIQARIGTPAARFHHGRSVIQYPLGNSANAAIVSGAIWDEQSPSRTTQYGEQIERMGVLFVPSDITVSNTDQWVIDSELWQTTRTTNNETGGLKELYLQRNDKQNVKGKRGPLL